MSPRKQKKRLMKRLTFTRLVLWIVIAILVIVTLSGCDRVAAPTAVTPIGPSAKLYTVEHAGHTFVVFYGNTILGKSGGVIHDPDCECIE